MGPTCQHPSSRPKWRHAPILLTPVNLDEEWQQRRTPRHHGHRRRGGRRPTSSTSHRGHLHTHHTLPSPAGDKGQVLAAMSISEEREANQLPRHLHPLFLLVPAGSRSWTIATAAACPLHSRRSCMPLSPCRPSPLPISPPTATRRGKGASRRCRPTPLRRHHFIRCPRRLLRAGGRPRRSLRRLPHALLSVQT